MFQLRMQFVSSLELLNVFWAEFMYPNKFNSLLAKASAASM